MHQNQGHPGSRPGATALRLQVPHWYGHIVQVLRQLEVEGKKHVISRSMTGIYVYMLLIYIYIYICICVCTYVYIKL